MISRKRLRGRVPVSFLVGCYDFSPLLVLVFFPPYPEFVAFLVTQFPLWLFFSLWLCPTLRTSCFLSRTFPCLRQNLRDGVGFDMFGCLFLSFLSSTWNNLAKVCLVFFRVGVPSRNLLTNFLLGFKQLLGRHRFRFCPPLLSGPHQSYPFYSLHVWDLRVSYFIPPLSNGWTRHPSLQNAAFPFSSM